MSGWYDIYIFIKIMGGRSSGWAYCYDEGGVFQKLRAPGFVQIAWKGKEMTSAASRNGDEGRRLYQDGWVSSF